MERVCPVKTASAALASHRRLNRRHFVGIIASRAPFARHDIRWLAAPANSTSTHWIVCVDYLGLRADRREYPVDKPFPCRPEFFCDCQRRHPTRKTSVVNVSSVSGNSIHHSYFCWIQFCEEASRGHSANGRGRPYKSGGCRKMSESLVYQIRIKDHLDESWISWFSPLVVVNEANGEAILTGAIRDQAELHGLLDKVFDLNCTLLAVKLIKYPYE